MMNFLKIFFLSAFIVLNFVHTAQAQSRGEYLAFIDTFSLADLREALRASARHGFDFRRYWSDEMEWTYRQGAMTAALKSQAGENYLQLLQDMTQGIVDPATVSADIKMQRKSFITLKQLRDVADASGNKPSVIIDNLAPQTELYGDLQKALGRLDAGCTLTSWKNLEASSRTLRPGMHHRALPALKERLRQLGYKIAQINDSFDDDVLKAVQDIQATLRLTPDGTIGPNGKTWKYLTTSCQDRLRQIRADMEKLRWFPQSWEDRHIFINLATNEFKLFDKAVKAEPLLSFRTISGRPTRPTPTMKDKVMAVVINPFWVVPPTIFREDKIEELRHLSKDKVGDYFYDHHYEVWDRYFTRQINPTLIDWKNLDPQADANFYIRQQPHKENVLGQLKFVLNNNFAIYLHDTNQPALFKEPQRLLSSGCVRLERPMELAEYLLKGTEWNRQMIEQEMAGPGEVMAGETKITLDTPVPVYMIYLTTQLSSDGAIRFSDDPYDQNTNVLRAGVW